MEQVENIVFSSCSLMSRMSDTPCFVHGVMMTTCQQQQNGGMECTECAYTKNDLSHCDKGPKKTPPVTCHFAGKI